MLESRKSHFFFDGRKASILWALKESTHFVDSNLLERSNCFIEFSLISRDNDEIGALLDQISGEHQTEPVTASSDDDSRSRNMDRCDLITGNVGSYRYGQNSHEHNSRSDDKDHGSNWTEKLSLSSPAQHQKHIESETFRWKKAFII